MSDVQKENKWLSSQQEKQMSILKSIDISLSESIKVQKSISSDTSKINASTLFIAKANETSTRNLAAITKNLLGTSESFVSDMKEFDKSAKEYHKILDDLNKSTKEYDNSIKKNTKELDKDSQEHRAILRTLVSDAGTLVKNIFSKLGGLSGIGASVDKLSDISNNMIQYSGMNGAAVKSFRSSIMNTVNELNILTGNLYSPTSSYESIVGLSRTITSDMEALKEMSKPLLLAQETMSVEMEGIADIFNRFYTRYNFSSMHMEGALEAIRGNTAGNSANAAATLENIKSLENWINYTSGNDNDMREKLLGTISHYTSWLESMNMDSKPFTKMLNDIAWGDYSNNTELINILSQSGITGLEATNMLKRGEYSEVTQALMVGIDKLFSKIEGSPSMWAFSNYGIDKDLGLAVSNLLDSANYKDLNQFIESLSTDVSAIGLAEDKYVSAADKANHWLEQIYARMASIQESLGFGLSDIAIGLALLRGVQTPGMIGNNLGKWGSKIIGSAPIQNAGVNLAMSGSSLVGNTAATGLQLAAGAGGVLAGGALMVDGIVGAFDKEKTTGSRVFSGVEGAAGAAGAIALAAGAGPLGWGLIALAGGAFAIKKVIDAVVPVSGLANKITKELEESKKAILSEQSNRVMQISSLEQSIKSAESFDDALELAKKSGLIPLNDALPSTIEGLLELAGAAKEAALEIGDKASLAYDTATKLLEDAAKAETKEVMKSLYESVLKDLDTVDAQTGERYLSEKSDPTKFAMYETAFTQMAEAIEDEKQRAETIAMVEKIFKNGKLGQGELGVLTDQHNQWSSDRAFWSTKIDFGKAASRHGQDMNAVNSILSGLGTDVYTSQVAQKHLDSMIKSYQEWGNSVDEASKNKHKESFIKEWSSVSDAHKNILRGSLQDIADQMGVTPFAIGTNYITRDQLALVHEGEAIVPKKYNPAANSEEFKIIANNIQQSQQESREESSKTSEHFSSFIEELREIRAFLAEWRKGNDVKETTERMSSRTLAKSSFIQQYLSY